MLKKLIYIVSFCLFSAMVSAQERTSTESTTREDSSDPHARLKAYYNYYNFTPRVTRPTYTPSQFAAHLDLLVEQQKQLMLDNIKKYEKLAKELEKPQYADFDHFGYKKKPKKKPLTDKDFR